MGHRKDKKRKERSGRRKRRETDSESGSESDDSERSDSPKFTEEEIREYLAKKAQKKAQKVAKRLRTSSVAGYSNDSNPFGDSNLNERFVWRKKIERDLSQGQTPSEMSLKAEKKRQRERMAEIEKVKKRREERAIEKAQHEEEMALLARERARAEYQDWQKKEEEFHFEQSKVRSEIRLREGRAKPIDVLSKNLNLSEDFEPDFSEPYKIYKGLTVKEMEELRQDIKMHLELDRATQTHIEFWDSMMVVCDWEIAQTRKRDALDRARLRGEEPPHDLLAEDLGLHGVDDEVDHMLQGLTVAELDTLQEQTESKMLTGTAQVVEYWEAVLKRLHIYKAKARLRQIHAELLRKHLKRIEYVDGYEERPVSEDRDVEEKEEKPASDWEEVAVSPEPVHETQTEDEEDAGNYSPEPTQEADTSEVLDPEADKADLERKRAEVLEEQQRRLQEAATRPAAVEEDPLELTPLERASVMKSMGGMEDGDTMLGPGSEVNLESQVYWWHDKYRPRKPKYFNRVHTGYEWNKYNQTHYDHDNPPPKIVQGYKFNIFYPDLVDKTKAPTYFIERDGSDGETCLIRFHAGPPYEDIAFRIVNKEWEYSHKKGFKCTFERGILHVYFNFKRYRLRRALSSIQTQVMMCTNYTPAHRRSRPILQGTEYKSHYPSAPTPSGGKTHGAEKLRAPALPKTPAGYRGAMTSDTPCHTLSCIPTLLSQISTTPLHVNSSLQYSRVDFIFCKSRTRISINCSWAPKSTLDSSSALTSNVKSSVCFRSLSLASCSMQTCPFVNTSTRSFFTFNSFCRSLHRFSTLTSSFFSSAE